MSQQINLIFCKTKLSYLVQDMISPDISKTVIWQSDLNCKTKFGFLQKLLGTEYLFLLKMYSTF